MLKRKITLSHYCEWLVIYVHIMRGYLLTVRHFVKHQPQCPRHCWGSCFPSLQVSNFYKSPISEIPKILSRVQVWCECYLKITMLLFIDTPFVLQNSVKKFLRLALVDLSPSWAWKCQTSLSMIRLTLIITPSSL